ncbi:hypothetical protein MAM1_0097c05112 [Mucor ambiguus]|uniref:Uncharacterized protein n=1 Tax=Mucor ambiguus TaxID=91626 RepID=A0A0C9LUU6_9FUNG|nr:hypothetical protein MAM1_0097c05112 [Mucor ambiguus]
MPLSIATNVSFEDENEGDAVDSKADDDNDNVYAVESKAINSHAEQEFTIDGFTLPPTAKYSEIWIHLRPNFSL